MFDQIEEPEEEEEEETNYTGVIIGVALLPVFLLFLYLGKEELGLVVTLVLGMAVFAVGLRWELRKHVWFWATIVLVLALHFYLIFVIHLPHEWLATIGRLHAIALLPIGVADLVIFLGAVGLAQRFASDDSSCDIEED
jgi:hypothetical protein